MATVEVTENNLEDLLTTHDVVVLDFWASWCGPCKRFAPIFEAASDKHPDVLFGKVNTEEQQRLAGAFGIQSIPTTVFFRDAVALHMQPGLLPAEGLEDLLGQIQKLDMDQVRAEILKQQQSDPGGVAES